MISEELGMKLENVDLSQLGRAKKVSVSKVRFGNRAVISLTVSAVVCRQSIVHAHSCGNLIHFPSCWIYVPCCPELTLEALHAG